MKHKKDNDLVDKDIDATDEQSIVAEPIAEAAENSGESDKIAELNDKYLRLAAEFDNYRRRTSKERMELILTASEDTIKGLLPTLDDCERALDVLRQSDATEAAIEGTELIYNKLMGYLKVKGLSKMECLGKELDTDFHDAVAKIPVEEDLNKNKIVEIVQHGYLLNGKVIRFAKVVVGV